MESGQHSVHPGQIWDRLKQQPILRFLPPQISMVSIFTELISPVF